MTDKTNFDGRFTLVLDGEVTAVTPLSVTQPGSGFGRRDDVKRLPRKFAGKKDSPAFFPSSTVQGALRHIAGDLITSVVNADDDKITVDQLYMIKQGYDTSDTVYKDVPDGQVARKGGLRDTNPMISLFGRWGLSGGLRFADLLPEEGQGQVFSIRGTGVRTNTLMRTPEQFESLNDEGVAKAEAILGEDSAIQKEIAVAKKEMRSIEASMRTADDKEKKAMQNQLAELETRIQDLEAGKVGGQNSIQRPLPGMEAFNEGVVFNSRASLSNINTLELGLFLHTLRAFSERPFLGSRMNGFGEVKGKYEFKHREKGSFKAKTMATVSFSHDEFAITETDGSTLLMDAYEQFAKVLENPQENGVQFGAFFFSDLAK